MPADRPPPRLFLVTPPEADAGFAPVLEGACRAGEAASVLIWSDGPDARRTLDRAKPLVAAAQAAGAAALMRGDAQLVARAGADGFHADGSEADLRAALDALRPERIVGAGNLRSRHDAMTAGEAGADYVFFGRPEPGETRGNALDLLVERAAWWQEIFETPCVVFAPALGDVAEIARAGADFVALGAALWAEPDPVEAARRAAEACSSVAEPA
jgi:thiamine-phosphate pyrophosphorylase